MWREETSGFALPASQPASKLVNIIKRRRLLSFYCWSTVQFSRTIEKRRRSCRTTAAAKNDHGPEFLMSEAKEKEYENEERWCKLFSPVVFLYFFISYFFVIETLTPLKLFSRHCRL